MQQKNNSFGNVLKNNGLEAIQEDSELIAVITIQYVIYIFNYLDAMELGVQILALNTQK